MSQATQRYSHLLMGLDGSEPSEWAGILARELAVALDAELTACHAYGAAMHAERFRDMEPGLPEKYQRPETLGELRDAHDDLIRDGFQSLSEGYIDAYVAVAAQAGIRVEVDTLEGRGHTGILQLAATRDIDLIVLGYAGLGAMGDGLLGSTATRVLRHAPCDVLLVRSAPSSAPIVAGVDGSPASREAAHTAVALGQALKRPVQLAAAYDPDFHTAVFRTMAGSLSAARQEDVGLADQEQLHDEIINDGLRKLYADFLTEAAGDVECDELEISTDLLTGKAYRALADHAAEAGLLVVGRHGYHHEAPADIGSNAEALARTAPCSVLIVGGSSSSPNGAAVSRPPADAPHGNAAPGGGLPWDPEAEARLARVPSFVRRMARGAVEKTVRERGGDRVMADDFEAVAARFGMGGGGQQTNDE